MWTLRSSPPSPFGRKIKIAASLCGLTDRIEVVKADTLDPEDDLRSQNPLGKIPALVIEDGTVLYDSRVILEFLDLAAGGGVIMPEAAVDRIMALRLEALADGILDANILVLYEARFRPEELHHQPWLDHQAGKVSRAIDYLEANPPVLGPKPNVGDIALACALGHRDFRFGGDWREDHPRLVAWLSGFEAAVPAYAETAPH